MAHLWPTPTRNAARRSVGRRSAFGCAPSDVAVPDVRYLTSSDVEVHLKLVRVRAEPDRVHLVGALVVDPRLDEVRGEDVAGEQVLVVGLERVEDGGERAGDLRDVRVLLRRQLVEVLVHRLRRLDPVLDP